MRIREDQIAFRRLSAIIQSFIDGSTIPVALEQDHEQAQWARLDPASREVWEIRVRHVKPDTELRISGRFAAIDTFVALNLYDYPIKGKRAWDQVKMRCQTDWQALFPTSPPLFGDKINDYISANVTLI